MELYLTGNVANAGELEDVMDVVQFHLLRADPERWFLLFHIVCYILMDMFFWIVLNNISIGIPYNIMNLGIMNPISWIQ